MPEVSYVLAASNAPNRLRSLTLSAFISRSPEKRNIVSPLKLALQLTRTARSVHPDPTLGDALARIKYFIRGIANPGLTAEWFELLANPELALLVNRHPHILSKLQRPYLHRRLKARERLAALKNHYCFVTRCVEPSVRQQVYSREGHVIASFLLPELGRMAIRLFYGSQFEKEGELSLGLFRTENTSPIFTLTFCVQQFSADGSQIFIGGLQGRQFENQKETVVRLTRGLHGLRPKAFLVFILQRLAQLWGCERILAVGGSEHIYRHSHKRKTLHAAYDEFWAECHGRQMPDGNFELPAAPMTRNIAELPAAKRAIYRRRYTMLEMFGDEIRERIHGNDAMIHSDASLVAADSPTV